MKKIWSEKLWFLIHFFAKFNTTHEAYKEFIEASCKVINCEECRKEFEEIIYIKMPIKEGMVS